MPVSGTVVGGYYLTFSGGPVPTNCILFGFGYNDTSDYDGDGFIDLLDELHQGGLGGERAERGAPVHRVARIERLHGGFELR